MKRIVITSLVLMLPLLATACNTFSGLGQDVKAGGEGIEKTADKHQNY